MTTKTKGNDRFGGTIRGDLVALLVLAAVAGLLLAGVIR